jgi:arabinose-5-phosphate isomerase
VHGDLGCLSGDDVVIALSNSGETEEICRLLPILRRAGVDLIAVTSTETNSLSASATVTIPLGRLTEADAHGLAPSTTTTAMLAIGDALAFVLSRLREFTPAEFARNHPGGSLGRQLKTVQEMMRPVSQVRLAEESVTVREVFTTLAQPGRRTGAVMLVDDRGRLSGIFTDSDLARLLESRCDDRLDVAIRHVMTKQPHTVLPHARLSDVIDLLADRKISEIPVVDEEHRPLGLIDITDVIGIVPTQEGAA